MENKEMQEGEEAAINPVVMERDQNLKAIVEGFIDSLEGLRVFTEFAEPAGEQKIKELAGRDKAAFYLFHLATGGPWINPDEKARKVAEKFGYGWIFDEGLNSDKRVDIEKVWSRLSMDQLKGFSRMLKDTAHVYKSLRRIHESALSGLVSAAENFIGALYTQHLKSYPGILSDQKEFSLNDIQSFGSLDDARDSLIFKKVELEMYGSLEDWIKLCKNSLSISIDNVMSDLPIMVEYFQRRNIWTHNGGVVNSSYMKKVPPQQREHVKLGETLWVTQEYVEAAITTVERNFLLIGFEYWRKSGNLHEVRGDTMVSACYECLLAQRYESAYAFAIDVQRDPRLSEAARTIGQLNAWLALKRLGKFDDIECDIRNSDFSAKSATFQMAKAAILEEEATFLDIAKRLVNTGELAVESLFEWPVLEEMRGRDVVKEFLKDLKPSHKLITETDSALTMVKKEAEE